MRNFAIVNWKLNVQRRILNNMAFFIYFLFSVLIGFILERRQLVLIVLKLLKFEKKNRKNARIAKIFTESFSSTSFNCSGGM